MPTWLKGIRPNSVGNTRLEKAYGGDGPPREHYAKGGAVKRIFKALGGGLIGGPAPDAEGGATRRSLGRSGRKAASKTHKGKGDGGIRVTTINMPPQGAAPMHPPIGPMAMAGKPPMPPPGPGAAGPPGPPPPPPGNAAGPPMPPRLAASGGRIRAMFKKGGRVKHDDHEEPDGDEAYAHGGKVGKPKTHHGGVVGKPKGVGHMIGGEAHGDGSPKANYAGKGFLKGDGDQYSNTSTAPKNKDTPKGGTKDVVKGAYDKWNYKEQTSNTEPYNRLPPAPKHRIADHNELKEDKGHDTTNQKLKSGGRVHEHHHHGGSHHKDHDGHHGDHEAHHKGGKHHTSHHTKGHHVEVHHHHHKKGGHVHKKAGGKVEHEAVGGGAHPFHDASSEGDHPKYTNEKKGGDVEHHRYGGKAGGRMSEHHDGYPAKYPGASKGSTANQEWHDGVLEAKHEDGHEKDVHLHERHGGTAHHHKAMGGRIPSAGNVKGAGLHNDEGGAGSGPGRDVKIKRFGE